MLNFSVFEVDSFPLFQIIFINNINMTIISTISPSSFFFSLFGTLAVPLYQTDPFAFSFDSMKLSYRNM